MTDGSNHYSYTFYADTATAEAFDDRRFGGPIGAIVAGTQARVLTNFVGRIQNRRILDGIFRSVGAVPVPVMETNSILTLCSHASAGHWSSIVPEPLLTLLNTLVAQL